MGVVRSLKSVEGEEESLVTLRSVLRKSRLVVGTESGQVRRDESRRRKFGLTRGKELLGTAGGELLQTPLDGSSGGLVLEALDDGAGSEV